MMLAMTVDPRLRFREVADLYERYRPGYPDALVEWIVRETGLRPGAKVADLGSGTGISSRLFQGHGFDVVGVEPNDAMRERAVRAGGGPRYVAGEAAATGLGDASVELVTVAQAFHWFEPEAALAEIARILVPGGACAVFWNLRSVTPLLDEYEALLRRFSTDYSDAWRPGPAMEAIRRSPRIRHLREREFELTERLTREQLFGRAHSASYVQHGVAEPEAFDRELAAIFDRHQEDGRVTWRYRTVALLFGVTR